MLPTPLNFTGVLIMSETIMELRARLQACLDVVSSWCHAGEIADESLKMEVESYKTEVSLAMRGTWLLADYVVDRYEREFRRLKRLMKFLQSTEYVDDSDEEAKKLEEVDQFLQQEVVGEQEGVCEQEGKKKRRITKKSSK